MAIEEKIQRNKISTADIPELIQWLLSSNPEEAKALQNSLNAEAPLKDWSRERLRELENQQPLDSNLILRLEALREMCRNIEHRAAALICAHNHPSGDPEPSQEDFRITERLVEVGKLVGIPVLDHVIVGGDNYTSFADKGLL